MLCDDFRVLRHLVSALGLVAMAACAPTPPVLRATPTAASDSATAAPALATSVAPATSAPSSAPTSAPSSTPPSTPTSPPAGRRFYTGKTYGSEGQFNPLTQLINEGYNNVALHSADLGLGRQPYGREIRNLAHSLSHIEQSYRQYGWSRAFHNEIFPLTGREGGQWVPNYQDHLFGSGMVSVRMTEWFTQHGYSHPELLSYTTMLASHVLNEIIEEPEPFSVDALTDLLIFDQAGFFLWRNDWIQRWFSGRVTLTNWAGQPVVTFPNNGIENTSQSFVLQAPLPYTKKWRAFYFWGVTHIIGVSRDIGNGQSISGGIGEGATQLLKTDTLTDTRTVTLAPKAGIFYDRNGSLMASFILEASHGTFGTLNIYPGLIHLGPNSPGLWLSVRSSGTRFGLTMPFGLGVGYGSLLRR